MLGKNEKRYSYAVFAALVWVVMVFAALPSNASAISAGEAIAKLNSERSSNGIPANIVENPAWSTDCGLLNQYEELNGGALADEESQGGADYTREGAWAAENSVLARGKPGWGEANPWRFAPIHLDQLLAPRTAEIGVAEANGYVCATTFPGWGAPPPASKAVYTYPGNGVTGVYPSEIASEQPYTPGQKIGIAAGATTGPYLEVFVDGPQITHYSGAATKARITSATLEGPLGSVAVDTVDNYTPGLLGSLAPGGMIIPLSPLSPNTAYSAHVEGTVNPPSGSAYSFSYSWTFKTGVNLPPEEHVSSLKKVVAAITVSGRSVSFASDSSVPGTLTAERPTTMAQIAPSKIGDENSSELPFLPGLWKVCVTEPAGGGYSEWKGCVNDEIADHPHLVLGKAEYSRHTWVAKLSVPHALLGKKLWVVEKLKHNHTYKRLLIPRSTITKISITGVKPNLLKIIATSNPFTVSDVRYDSATASRLY